MDSERSQKFEMRELRLLKCVIAMRIGGEYHPVTMNARLSANSVNKMDHTKTMSEHTNRWIHEAARLDPFSRCRDI